MTANVKRIHELVQQIKARASAVNRMEKANDADRKEILDLMVAEGLEKQEFEDIEAKVLRKDKTEIRYQVAEILSLLPIEEAAGIVKVGKAELFDKAVRAHPELAKLREVSKVGETVAIEKLKKA
jgi:hypothetical protein